MANNALCILFTPPRCLETSIPSTIAVRTSEFLCAISVFEQLQITNDKSYTTTPWRRLHNTYNTSIAS